jgi:hypothetical protein
MARVEAPSATKFTAFSRRRRRSIGAGLLVLAATLIGLGVIVSNDHSPAHLCTLQLAFVTVEGRTIALEDQGKPGRDGCDITVGFGVSARSDPAPVLGYDCRIRDSERHVVGKYPPNRRDGTCGQAEPS